MTFDLTVQGGQVLDGTGTPARRADVGIRGGRIAEIGDLRGQPTRDRVEAGGLIVSPGFIDTHGHSDFGVFAHPTAESHVAQGITTELAGNCGGSAFPISDAGRSLHFFPAGVDVSWKSAAEYFGALDDLRPAINVASLIGHSAVRATVMGLRQEQPAPFELAEMRKLVRQGIAAGARGLSFGGHFAPSMFADEAELTVLAREVAGAGGGFFSHLRDYGPELLPAIDETLRIAEAAGVRAHVSLLKPFGRRSWGQARAALDRLAAARERGLAVTTETMAYSTAGAWWGPRAVFPADVYDWRRDDLESVIARLRDPAQRRELAKVVEERRTMPKSGFEQEYLIFSDWRDVTVVEVAGDGPNTELVGRSIAEIADRRGMPPVEVFFDLLIAEGRSLGTVNAQISEQDHEAVLADPWAAVGIDGIVTSPDGFTAPVDRIQQHPRHWGSFPRVLGHYVRERGLLALPEAVRKMTSLAARIAGLEDRGVLREGAWADLVVFDPATVAPAGTWREPVRYPTGIKAVLVNGAVAAEDGRPTGSRSGRALRGKLAVAA